MDQAFARKLVAVKAVLNFPIDPDFAVLNLACYAGVRFRGAVLPAARTGLLIPDVGTAQAAIYPARGN